MQLLEAMVDWRRRLEADVEVSVNASWTRFKAVRKRYGTQQIETVKSQVQDARAKLEVDKLSDIRNNLGVQLSYLSSLINELTQLKADPEKMKAGSELKAKMHGLKKFNRDQLKDCEKAAKNRGDEQLNYSRSVLPVTVFCAIEVQNFTLFLN
jgi:hypothetical protein